MYTEIKYISKRCFCCQYCFNICSKSIGYSFCWKFISISNFISWVRINMSHLNWIETHTNPNSNPFIFQFKFVRSFGLATKYRISLKVWNGVKWNYEMEDTEYGTAIIYQLWTIWSGQIKSFCCKILILFLASVHQIVFISLSLSLSSLLIVVGDDMSHIVHPLRWVLFTWN